MVTGIIIAALLVGGTGLLIGVFLGFAGMKLAVEVDEKEEAVRSELPGNNCGGCGFPGCDGLAKAIAAGEAPVDACPVGGSAVGNKIASIMGLEAKEGRKMVAFVHCSGDCDKTSNNYEYNGIHDCGMMQYVPTGGPKSCRYGCTGYGNCVKVCPFEAISVINGVAVIDKEKCKACGKCIDVCPKHLISLIPYDAKFAVACSSTDKGPVAMKACSSACIGCGLCMKACPNGAVKVENFHAIIDQEKCVGCGLCAEKCPKKAIVKA